MPKSKEVLESEDSYASDEDKPRTKKAKITVKAAKKQAAPPPAKKNNTKSKAEEDEDDAGEESDENRDEAKTKNGASGKRKLEDDEDDSGEAGANGYQLSRLRFVNVSGFRGKPLVNIREFYEKDGQILPGKKGIALSIEQWENLKKFVAKIDNDLKNFK